MWHLIIALNIHAWVVRGASPASLQSTFPRLTALVVVLVLVAAALDASLFNPNRSGQLHVSDRPQGSESTLP